MMILGRLATAPSADADWFRTYHKGGTFMDQSIRTAQYAPRRSTLSRFVATALLLTVAACSHLGDSRKPPPDKNAPRAQLSIGYSLLYQEADGIPKLKWILMFKDKPEEMGQLTNDLVSYYQQLADTMQKLSKQYPAMRIDVAAMSEIEGDERKAIGTDLAKDFAPLIGKTGVEFEREALLMFYDSLNEQRHLTGVMVGLETDPALRKFLETTKAQLDARYAKVGALLNRRYFTH
jgi:predicted small lipoprotein YifL